MKRRISFLLSLLVLFCLLSSCRSEEDRIKEEAIETAHSWLEWKYDPMGGISYSDEVVVPHQTAYGDWEVDYSANVFCVSRPFKKSHPDSVISISGFVSLDMVYSRAENRMLITNSILP